MAAQKTVAGVQKLNESKYSLVERYASVYYDEQMNPFGAPAPGQPKLYYADIEGKSTTMDSRRAVVPAKWRTKFESEGGGKDVEETNTRVARKRRWDDPGGNGNTPQMMMMPPPVHPALHQMPPPPPVFLPPPPHPVHMMVSYALLLFSCV